MLSVLTILWTATALSAQSTRLCSVKNGQSVSRDALSFNVIQLGLTDTTYTWQATRGRGNITVEYSDDVNVRFTEQGKKLTVTASGSQTSKAVGVPSHFPMISIITCVYFLLCLGDRKWFFWASLTIIVVCSFSMATEDSCLDKGSIHLLIPVESIETICFNDVCKPVLCELSPFSDYSSLPSNTRLLFEDDFCAITKPERWDEWIEHYFGPNSTADYYGDIDGDGLVNILEYYGASAFKNAFVIGYGQDERWQSTTPISTTTTTTLPVRERRDIIPISELGTNPLSADSDGDLLQDGFELFNGLNPKAKDVTSGDYDNDLLDNLKEQILGTDPRNPDSDGDGIPDGTEVQTGGNPRNPADKGQTPPNKLTADVQLTVGDHSGSHSERYVLHVGDIAHQSPGFGLVGSGTYKFITGTYTITLQHAGSNRKTPDYDYTARLQKMGGGAKVTISDPTGMLGAHGESSPFYAAGKSATLIVEDDCSEDPSTVDQECECAKLKRCEQCKANAECVWDTSDKKCSEDSIFQLPWIIISGDEQCPCEQCKGWYDSEKDHRNWLQELNQQFPCPCSVTINTFSLTPNDHPTGNWGQDWACMVHGLPMCSTFHPGANGCLRSSTNTAQGARQQCCYGDDGILLAPDASGAGTPDRSGSFSEHQEVDVKTFEWCCKECEVERYCDYYMELRRGSNEHCAG